MRAGSFRLERVNESVCSFAISHQVRGTRLKSIMILQVKALTQLVPPSSPPALIFDFVCFASTAKFLHKYRQHFCMCFPDEYFCPAAKLAADLALPGSCSHFGFLHGCDHTQVRAGHRR
eukprot:SAG31_NODE_695_length_12765_cov_6.974499_2_plen_119_part_00